MCLVDPKKRYRQQEKIRLPFFSSFIGEFMNKRNYQKELEKKLEELQSGGGVPTLFLHSCCAPCSSYVLEYLSRYFEITVFYYNPNITEDAEYRKRVIEQKRLIGIFNAMGDAYPIEIVEGDYVPEQFFAMSRGYEKCPEGGERCFRCYEMRLRETALQAKKAEADYFTTTLTISPLKNAAKINEIGQQLSEELEVPFLPSDFKKKNGYKRSVELSKEYDLYRQDYCGCIFSKAEREEHEKAENRLE